MKITSIAQQAKNKNRVNISVDGMYRFSLDIFQVGELGIKVGKEYSEKELRELETESQFGKLYARTIEYCMSRPHSVKEVRDYLWRKTQSKKYRHRKTGEIKERPGVGQDVADRVLDRVQEKGYVNDEQFTRWWVENRNLTKGTSRRKLSSELAAKGVAREVIETALENTERSDESELQKIIAKKHSKYPDRQKFIAYLARQGFRYDDISQALTEHFDD